MQPISMLAESEGQIRRGWSEFLATWTSIEAGWRDHRRLAWEKQVIDTVPSILSLTTSAIAELRSKALKAESDLSDPDRETG